MYFVRAAAGLLDASEFLAQLVVLLLFQQRLGPDQGLVEAPGLTQERDEGALGPGAHTVELGGGAQRVDGCFELARLGQEPGVVQPQRSVARVEIKRSSYRLADFGVAHGVFSVGEANESKRGSAGPRTRCRCRTGRSCRR